MGRDGAHDARDCFGGVSTFLFQGVRRGLWWDQDRAARMVRAAVVVWAYLLVLLVALIWWSWRG